MEVTGATDVVVRDHWPVRGGCGPFAIEVRLQDRGDGRVGPCADIERPVTGGFEPLGAEGLGVPQNADACSEALLRVGLLAQYDLDEGRRLGANIVGLAPDALGRLIGMASVARRHVVAHGRVLAVR